MATKPREVKQIDWSQRVQEIFDVYWKRMLNESPDLEDAPGHFKEYFRKTIERVGPINYSNIKIVWAQLVRGPYFMQPYRECVTIAWSDAAE